MIVVGSYNNELQVYQFSINKQKNKLYADGFFFCFFCFILSSFPLFNFENIVIIQYVRQGYDYKAINMFIFSETQIQFYYFILFFFVLSSSPLKTNAIYAIYPYITICMFEHEHPTFIRSYNSKHNLVEHLFETLRSYIFVSVL